VRVETAHKNHQPRVLWLIVPPLSGPTAGHNLILQVTKCARADVVQSAERPGYVRGSASALNVWRPGVLLPSNRCHVKLDG
jgi:hypothetical protein